MEKETTVQIVTIPVHSDIDPSELLDIIISIRENIIEHVEQQCIECFIFDEEISVEYLENKQKEIIGGDQYA